MSDIPVPVVCISSRRIAVGLLAAKYYESEVCLLPPKYVLQLERDG